MSDQITFTMDGEEVTADKGMTIWEVANGRDLIIPHLCHKPQPGYRPDGNCRACMVEVEGERTLVASCIREANEGMVVTTIRTARKARARWLWKCCSRISQSVMYHTTNPLIFGIWRKRMG
jgi:formate dehydrogenase major subunit